MQKKPLQLGLGYFGGKQRKAPFMEKFFPTFKRYCEPFGGTMKNFVSTDLNCNDVIYNDNSFYQANMMAAFKYPEKFYKEFKKQLMPDGKLFHLGLIDTIKNRDVLKKHYEALFYEYGKIYVINRTINSGKIEEVDFEAAVMYAFCLAHSVLGVPLKSFTCFQGEGMKPRFLKTMAHLKELIGLNKFSPVQFYCQDGIQTIKEQDSEESFFVIDPGYIGMEHFYRNRARKGKRKNVSEDLKIGFTDAKMHLGLAKTLNQIKGKFMLCYYYHPLLEKLYPRDKFTWIAKNYWRSSTNTTTSEKRRNEMGMELLILNYDNATCKNERKIHLLESAKESLPNAEGKRTRSSYSLEFKQKVINIIESKLFTRKEILLELGIKSYSTLKNWWSSQERIKKTLICLHQAKEYLRTVMKSGNSKNKSKVKLIADKPRNIIGELYQKKILSKKSIQKLFGISGTTLKKCYEDWSAFLVKRYPRKTKIARFLVYSYKNAA